MSEITKDSKRCPGCGKRKHWRYPYYCQHCGRSYAQAEGNLTQDAADLRHTCGECGNELQFVRPGKYQCVNPKCGASR